MNSNNLLDWEDHQVDHLFLLIGENPLPNYLAARTLLKEGGTAYLVFTKNTIFQKDRLQGEDGLHKLDIKCQPVDLSNNESDAQEIYDIIKKRVEESAKEGKVGLNYTGGTKAMAVHAYRAIQELKPDAIFSYLDPRRLKMWINQGNQKPVAYDVPLQISLEELFTLHGKYLLTNFPPRLKPYLQDLAVEIAKLHENQDSEKKWKEWCNKLTPIADLQILFPAVGNLLGECLDLPTNKSLKDKAKAEGFSDFKEFHTWLNGTWLESYALKKIQMISDDIGVRKEDIQMSFNIVEDKNKMNTNNKAADAKFEFDVAFIKRYQLFAISCTAKSKKADCKEKLFEASLRAKELGGDEARVALVCCYDAPQEIEDELARFGTRDPKVKVFGRKDLANIGDEILAWVDGIEQEAKA
ncbi:MULTISPECIES: Card1-like endonuclease domain-containing protein [Kamptonema]|uniref:Card1-like endonuclease domain-containing protein n=1 Tax=Kamptonema TaxID=1501433 RepID=UPI0001DAC5FF|nr:MULTISPECIES: DUF1887 family CARF protein [Kamptonema]CBN58550.1 conserved hypothetical protein [Kamptonema sp. PCC 6506]